MTDLELQVERKKLELSRVQHARMEMEFTIKERLADIARIKINIEVQTKREAEIKSQLEN